MLNSSLQSISADQRFKHQFEQLLQDNDELNKLILSARAELSPAELSELSEWAATQLKEKLLATSSRAILVTPRKPRRDQFRDDW